MDTDFYPARHSQGAPTQTRTLGEEDARSHHSRYPTPGLWPWQLPLGLNPLHAVGGPYLYPHKGLLFSFLKTFKIRSLAKATNGPTNFVVI